MTFALHTIEWKQQRIENSRHFYLAENSHGNIAVAQQGLRLQP